MLLRGPRGAYEGLVRRVVDACPARADAGAGGGTGRCAGGGLNGNPAPTPSSPGYRDPGSALPDGPRPRAGSLRVGEKPGAPALLSKGTDQIGAEIHATCQGVGPRSGMFSLIAHEGDAGLGKERRGRSRSDPAPRPSREKFADDQAVAALEDRSSARRGAGASRRPARKRLNSSMLLNCSARNGRLFLTEPAVSDHVSAPAGSAMPPSVEADRREIALRRGPHNRLGFAYQVAFVRVLGRFPQQAPLEIDGEILKGSRPCSSKTRRHGSTARHRCWRTREAGLRDEHVLAPADSVLRAHRIPCRRLGT